MVAYEGYAGGQVTVYDDVVRIRPSGLGAKEVPIPLGSILGVEVKDASRLVNGWLRVVFAAADGSQLTSDKVLFTKGSSDSIVAVAKWLESVAQHNQVHGVPPSPAADLGPRPAVVLTPVAAASVQPPGPPALAGTSGWWLRGHGAIPVVDVDQDWAQSVRATVERRPRAGHTTDGHAKAGRDGIVWLFTEGGQPIGHLSATDSAAYASAFRALEKTKRHGRVRLTVDPTSFKSGGTTWVHLVTPPHYPCIPANQPPDGLREADDLELDVKDEHKHKGVIETISRGMNASPAFFVIGTPHADGQVPVYAPLPGKGLEQCQVGVISKAGTTRATALVKDGPVWCPGMVWWRERTPQIELSTWYG